MTIDKAIEILTDICNFVEPADPPEEHNALKLGIEALKRHQERACKTFSSMMQPLPGEDSK